MRHAPLGCVTLLLVFGGCGKLLSSCSPAPPPLAAAPRATSAYQDSLTPQERAREARLEQEQRAAMEQEQRRNDALVSAYNQERARLATPAPQAEMVSQTLYRDPPRRHRRRSIGWMYTASPSAGHGRRRH